MFSNLPTMLQQQDFQTANRDMLVAARGGEALSAEAIATARMRNTIVVKVQRHDHEAAKYLPRKDDLAIFAEATRRFMLAKQSAVCASIAGWFLNSAAELVECFHPKSPILPPSSQD